MPASLTTTLLAFGAVLTAVDAVAGACVAGIGVVWEIAVRAATTFSRNVRIEPSE